MTRRLAHLAALAAALAGSGCVGWQSALDPHAVQARTLTHVMVFFIVVCTVVWVVVMGVLLMALRRRHRPQGDAGGGTGEAGERRLRRTVSAGVIATAAIVSVLTVVSVVAAGRITAGDPNALVIRVRGFQFWWEVTYTDARPDQTFLSANEIHVPVGRPVRIELSAADVIHSFWVPNLAGKQDLIPGRGNEVNFTVERAGIYRGQCAEFCGLQHARMAFMVIADEPAAFEAWRAAQLAPAAVRTGAEEAAGRQVFVARACSACHTVRGTPAGGTLGPDLTHVASRRTIGAGLLQTTRGSFAAWIADPQTLKPGNTMPMVALSADELKAVSAYMASLE